MLDDEDAEEVVLHAPFGALYGAGHGFSVRRTEKVLVNERHECIFVKKTDGSTAAKKLFEVAATKRGTPRRAR